ncbi:carbohydrate sulfotransferase 15-like [Patiria miniata]|uniref:Sulfotransferase domain-containing protein n=1 Tax=Patiria miniata TaxID=46514 RepID=A0A914A2T4_PATMI|nr:carbohydrate sulfotransferase 15-like [Patiria miniata]
MYRRKRICKQFCVFAFPTLLVLALVLGYSIDWSVEQERSGPHGRTDEDDGGEDLLEDFVRGMGSLSSFDYDQPVNLTNNQTRTNVSEPFAKATYANVPRALYRFAPEVFDAFPSKFLPNIRSPCWTDPRTEELNCLPSFFVAGFPKCGTSDVYAKLYRHPGIVRTKKKEPHWWTRNRFNGSLLEYTGNFQTLAKRISANASASKNLISGDASVATAWKNDNWRLFFPTANEPLYVTAELIHQVLPKSKIIFLLRDPIERAFSDYLYINFLRRRKNGWEGPKVNVITFHRDVLMSIAILKACMGKGRFLRSCSYDYAESLRARITVSHYVVYLRDWLQAFPRDQIFVLQLEDWKGNCEKWLPKLYSFLEQEKLSDETIREICKKKMKNGPRFNRKVGGELLNITRSALDQWYAPFNEELAKFLRDNDM